LGLEMGQFSMELGDGQKLHEWANR
jgi:hypothetical protein